MKTFVSLYDFEEALSMIQKRRLKEAKLCAKASISFMLKVVMEKTLNSK